MAQQRAEGEYELYHRRRIAEQARVGSDFDQMTKKLTDGEPEETMKMTLRTLGYWRICASSTG
jgi:hypothetical protein